MILDPKSISILSAPTSVYLAGRRDSLNPTGKGVQQSSESASHEVHVSKLGHTKNTLVASSPGCSLTDKVNEHFGCLTGKKRVAKERLATALINALRD